MIIANSQFPPIAIVNSVPILRPNSPIELSADVEAYLISMGWAAAMEPEVEVKVEKPKTPVGKKAARGLSDADLS